MVSKVSGVKKYLLRYLNGCIRQLFAGNQWQCQTGCYSLPANSFSINQHKLGIDVGAVLQVCIRNEVKDVGVNYA